MRHCSRRPRLKELHRRKPRLSGLKPRGERRKRWQQAAAAQERAAAGQTSALAFPKPSISRDEMQAFFEDKEYILRQIITEYNRKNRIHVRGAAADPRATKIFSVSVRSALPPSVGDGRYADVNFAVKDGRNEVFRPFRFGILWNDGEAGSHFTQPSEVRHLGRRPFTIRPDDNRGREWWKSAWSPPRHRRS